VDKQNKQIMMTAISNVEMCRSVLRTEKQLSK